MPVSATLNKQNEGGDLELLLWQEPNPVSVTVHALTLSKLNRLP